MLFLLGTVAVNNYVKIIVRRRHIGKGNLDNRQKLAHIFYSLATITDRDYIDDQQSLVALIDHHEIVLCNGTFDRAYKSYKYTHGRLEQDQFANINTAIIRADKKRQSYLAKKAADDLALFNLLN